MSKAKLFVHASIVAAGTRLMRSMAVLPIVATLLTSAAIVGSSTVPAAATHACFSQSITSDFKLAYKKSKAREKARASWNKKAQSATGTTRVNWKWAKGHEWSCTKPALRWKCRGRAFPCVG
jgi:hypothetical protein